MTDLETIKTIKKFTLKGLEKVNISMLQMYWILKLDDIIEFFKDIGAITFVILCIGILAGLMLMPGFFKIAPVREVLILASFLIIISALISTFLPTTKQLAAIIIIPKIIKNEQMQEIPEELLSLGLEQLRDLESETKIPINEK